MDNHNTTPTPPAGQVEAVARAMMDVVFDDEDLAKNSSLDWSGNDIWGCDFEAMAIAAIKASGAEHIAGLIGALEKVKRITDPAKSFSDNSPINDIVSEALSTLPPELRGKR